METLESSKRTTKLRLLLMEEGEAGEDPTIWEIDYNDTALPGDPRRPAEKLHAWLRSNEICACRPRRLSEQPGIGVADEKERSLASPVLAKAGG
jgi:hypothetical protein